MTATVTICFIFSLGFEKDCVIIASISRNFPCSGAPCRMKEYLLPAGPLPRFSEIPVKKPLSGGLKFFAFDRRQIFVSDHGKL
jgi:hypothetical protein